MSEIALSRPQRRHRPFGAVLWFVWMVGMWAAFFVLLLANQLDEIWKSVIQLPIVVEVLVWIAFFPWMLGTWVWTGSWAPWLRVVLVLCFAIGWSVVSIPRSRRVRA